jgi:IS1 family transposase
LQLWILVRHLGKDKWFPVNILSPEKQTTIIAALTEGCSIRATERLTDTHRDSVMRLGIRVGDGCRQLLDGMLRDLNVNVIEMDEQWAFIQKKAKRVRPGDPKEFGDCYLFLALDATSKAVLTYVVGKRSAENTRAIVRDLRARVLNRPQITADGWPAYPDAIESAFGDDVDFATIVKNYTVTAGNEAAVRYSPGKIRSTERTVLQGDPDPAKISTSYVERFNLTTRMASRRFTRLSNGFSKKLANHQAAIALHIAHYNLCRVHETIRCTPAMALGITDHVWTIGELIEAALSASTAPPMAPAPEPTRGMSAGRAKGSWGGDRSGLGAAKPGHKGPSRFRVVKGGRASR